MKVKRCQGVKNHVQRLNELELFIARILLTLGVLIILNLSKSPGVVTQKSYNELTTGLFLNKNEKKHPVVQVHLVFGHGF